MCGIVALIRSRELEYGAYVSAGIATANGPGQHCRKAEGKLVNLAACMGAMPLIALGEGEFRCASDTLVQVHTPQLYNDLIIVPGKCVATIPTDTH